jgi:hypothetical protein
MSTTSQIARTRAAAGARVDDCAMRLAAAEAAAAAQATVAATESP